MHVRYSLDARSSNQHLNQSVHLYWKTKKTSEFASNRPLQLKHKAICFTLLSLWFKEFWPLVMVWQFKVTARILQSKEPLVSFNGDFNYWSVGSLNAGQNTFEKSSKHLGVDMWMWDVLCPQMTIVKKRCNGKVFATAKTLKNTHLDLTAWHFSLIVNNASRKANMVSECLGNSRRQWLLKKRKLIGYRVNWIRYSHCNRQIINC